MRTNRKKTVTAVEEKHPVTGGGAKAAIITTEQQLRRSVMSCLLWEDNAYEDGVKTTERIAKLVKELPQDVVANIAIEAREQMNLRHIPLFIVREMARLKGNTHVAPTLTRIIQRADELAEFVSLYWKDGKKMLTNQIKKGLAAAFAKFDEYQLAKWSRDTDVKIRDVMFLCHPRPKDAAKDSPKFTKAERKAGAAHALTQHETLLKKLTDKAMATPDTWEVAFSGGADKKTTWERLLKDGKAGTDAILKNLRKMGELGVDKTILRDAMGKMRLNRVMPYRFIPAYRHAPEMKDEIESAMVRCLQGMPKLPGKTVLVIDTSGSMNRQISSKSELTRMDAAIALCILARELCETVVIYATAGDDCRHKHATAKIPDQHGFAIDNTLRTIDKKIGGGGIFLVQCMDHIKAIENDATRVVVLTDEQDCDQKLSPDRADAFGDRNYLINIGCEENGIGYGKWIHIDGFSTTCLNYIRVAESDTRSYAKVVIESVEEMSEAGYV